MLISMTGYGNGTAVVGGVSATAELRSVNNRFYEFSARLPKSLQPRENELKELVRAKAGRGKVTLSVSIDRGAGTAIALSVNADIARGYKELLTSLRDTLGIEGAVTLDHMLRFSDVFTADDTVSANEDEWTAVTAAVTAAAEMLSDMRGKEGGELARDLAGRLDTMETALVRIQELSAGRSEIERARLRERIEQVLAPGTVDAQRLEMEIVMLADKMDITEELVRFRSHLKFFRDAIASPESEGRKMTFLLQEINREANTIGSKSYDADIAYLVVGIKEELERIREQLQNVE